MRQCAKALFVKKPKAFFSISMLFITLSSIFLYFYPTQSSAQLLPMEEVRDQIHVKEGFFIFWCDSLYTKSYVNPLNETLPLFVESGILSWNIKDAQISNATVFDNLGNRFNAVLRDTMIQNPDINVDVPPLFIYKLTLSFVTTSGFSTVGLATFYRFYLIPVAPTKLTIAFPSDFTILNFTKGATLTRDNSSIELNWSLERNIYADISVGFLPFQATATSVDRWITLQTTIKYGISVDISSVFPAKGYVLVDEDEVYHIPASIDGWNVDISNVPATLSFPPDTTEVLVDEVWDGFGPLMVVYAPIINLTSENRGYYYVDSVNRKVWAYPRWRLVENNYEIMVRVHYRIPAQSTGFTLLGEVSFPFLVFQIPTISYMSHAASSERKTPADIISNITSSGEVRFLLPQNTVPDLSRSTPGAIQGSENGRPVVYWLINPSGGIEAKDYIIVYDVRQLKDGFILGCAFLGLELLAASAMIVLKKHFDGKDLIIPTLITSFPVSYVIISFTVLGGAMTLLQLPIFSIFLLQITISIVPILFLTYYHRRNKKKVNYIA